MTLVTSPDTPFTVAQTARQFPQFYRALTVDLVEISPILRREQAKRLGVQVSGDDAPTRGETSDGISLAWHATLQEVPDDLPQIIIGNEFFDALPVHHFIYTRDGWRERLIDLDDDPKSPLHFRSALSLISPTPALISAPSHRSPSRSNARCLISSVQIRVGAASHARE